MVSFAYFHKVNVYLLQNSHTPLLEKFLVTWASFSRHGTNFRPAGKFDRTLGPHETVQYFRFIHTGLKGKASKFHTVSLVPRERKT